MREKLHKNKIIICEEVPNDGNNNKKANGFFDKIILSKIYV